MSDRSITNEYRKALQAALAAPTPPEDIEEARRALASDFEDEHGEDVTVDGTEYDYRRHAVMIRALMALDQMPLIEQASAASKAIHAKAMARIEALTESLLRVRAVCSAATESPEEVRLANRALDALEGKA